MASILVDFFIQHKMLQEIKLSVYICLLKILVTQHKYKL